MVYALSVGVAGFLLALAGGGPLVAWLRRRGLGKAPNPDAPARHAGKAGTPTIGGLLILGVVLFFTATAILARDLSIALPLGATLAAGFLGFVDDLGSLQGRPWWALPKRLKLPLLFLLGLAVAATIYYILDEADTHLPGAGWLEPGLWYLPAAALVAMAGNAAVAITDGLDGLAAGTSATALAAYGAIALLQDQEPLAAFAFATAGATLGFLWFNAYPAQVFMGDTGALALGAAVTTVALMTGQWLLLPVIGIVFVLEGLSDVIQIAYFKATRGRRIFRMSPLHHHFELLGWSEPQVVTRFWLLGMAGALLGVALAVSGEGWL
ncbi:MAG TPA: phospho-N-acetylmuramoyl-pentapeptide-transferase [Dehalococcoidia bacterium]|nr:phospho-N-acetylmuramoyl-pentapeptide-transferase [Dehalococcoidia bacterium]